MLFTILNPKCSMKPDAMRLSDLRGLFEKTYKNIYRGQHRSFKDIAGKELLSFLNIYYKWFDVSVGKKNEFMVKALVSKKRPNKKRLSSDLDSIKSSERADDTDYQSAMSCVSDIEDWEGNLYSEMQTQSSTETLIDREDLHDFEDTEEDDDRKSQPWKEVKRKRRKALTSKQHESLHDDASLHRHDESDKNDEDRFTTEEKQCLFKNLIGKKSDCSLFILSSDSCYVNNCFKFMLDIVSMWNTPNRTTSYIVIGVDPKSALPRRLIGIQCRRENTFYQELFDSAYFNLRPKFKYFEVEFESKYFGIIEIPTSSGCGSPSITKSKGFYEDTCYFEPNQLWYHTDKGPKCCIMTDMQTGLIYRWFLTTEGDDSKKSSSQKSEKLIPVKKVKDISTKNAGTSTSSSSTFSDDIHVYNKPELFSKEMGNFSKNNYVLVAGDFVLGMKHLEAISLVPWVAVYDFDICSRDNGLLCANEESLRKRRSLHISHLKARPPSLSESGTVWTLLRGSRDIPESRIENENDCRLWYKHAKTYLKNHIEQLQKFACDYTVLNIIFFWPKNEFLAQFMHKFLSKIDDEIEPTPKLVLCLPSTPKEDKGKSVYEFLCNEYGDHLSIMKMDIDKVCLEIKHCLQNQLLQQNVKYELPTSDGSQNPCIKESEAAWLKEDIDVLYLQNVFKIKGVPITLDKLKEETEQFFKGGNLQWGTWYECGTGLDVDRDIKGNIITKINNLLEENKSNMFSLFHEPGSGGTTLAQRILWEYHSLYPSCQIRLNTSSSVNDIAEKIEYLHSKTHKQIIMMVDGEDDIKMKTLMRIIRNGPAVVIAIYVKRFSEKISDIQSRNEVLLKGNVSSREAKRLALQFSSRCDDDNKRKSLEKLSKDVENKINHCLYEFGLTTYLHEFKGVSAFVKGYLNLNQNRELLPWQKILGYLSLVYYYGQTSLPCQFFSQLLRLSSNYDVTFEDLGHPVEKFVVPSINEGRSKNIRICHFLIAKEILEQILSRHTVKAEDREVDLSYAARKNLADFCMEFIEYASKKKSKVSSNILHILTKTFIFRDSKYVSKHTEQTKKRPIISKVLSDICSKPPLFTERLRVLEKLTSSFPLDPNFHAHLGRFYAYCRPDDEKKAEKCFAKALELCNDYIKDKDICDIDERWRLSFMHIYHMYGTVLQKRISKVTGSIDQAEKECDLLAQLDEVVELAETACLYFQQCREFAPPGNETTAGHVGEITVRLHVCDFVQKNFERTNKCRGIQKFLSAYEKEKRQGVDFVKHSVSLIDSLIMECYTEIDEDDHTDYPLQKVVLWYNNLFQPQNVDLEKFATGDDIFSHRLRIAAKKLQYSQCHKGESFTLLDNITSAEDLKDIVYHYEEIFKSVSSSSVDKKSNKLLERDYIEWLFAIRHKLFPEDYDLERVLLTVRQWNDYLKSPLSKFYLFILTNLLGFGTSKEKGKSESLVEAQIIKEELHKVSKFVLKPRYPREWLGKSEKGIRRLHPGSRLLGFHPDDQEVEVLHQSKLALCKGTICHPNKKKSNGLINLDLGNNTVPVKVFYIPNVANLASSQYAGQRVEFILGFSLNHGYEAFDVKILKKHGCSTCSNKEEILSENESSTCSNCGEFIFKNDLNVLFANLKACLLKYKCRLTILLKFHKYSKSKVNYKLIFSTFYLAYLNDKNMTHSKLFVFKKHKKETKKKDNFISFLLFHDKNYYVAKKTKRIESVHIFIVSIQVYFYHLLNSFEQSFIYEDLI
ncbi:hypothetical protein KUTeg_016360 [Tegillarca granosa]|uniref:Sterile alpha motif domain-containing protein 9-like n=1 Tax=Tegillarca granosa TaxID=220873 RepID=A0ABQ9EQH5_TEGGR|nr:hypothetical protein KUTeg_016360 [Tegillarca granosa]